MVDISKCKGEDCPINEECYRFVAPDSQWQSYFQAVPIEDGECLHFQPASPTEIQRWKEAQTE